MKIYAARLYVSPRSRPVTAEEAETRRIAYAIKENNPAEIAEAAREMACLVDGPCWLVPVPTSRGTIAPNLALALEIAKNADAARVAPHLHRTRPVPSSCERHRNRLGPIPVAEHGFIRRGPFLTVYPLYFVDNVTTSGNTLEAARLAFGFGEGLVFADASGTNCRPSAERLNASHRTEART